MPSGDTRLSPEHGNVWQARFVKWCIRLLALNKEQEKLRDPSLLREVWGLWLESHVSLSRYHTAVAVRAAKETSLDSEKLEQMFSEALEADPQAPWDAPLTETEEPASPSSEHQSSGGQSENNKTTGRGSRDWVLPPPQPLSAFEVGQKDHRGWEEKFVAWCKSLIHLNDGKIKAGTPRARNRVTEAYLRWVGTIEGLSKIKTAIARRSAVHYAQENSALLAAIFAGDASPPNEPQAAESGAVPEGDSTASPMAAPPDTPADGSVPDGLLGGEDAEYREKYFPGIGPNETFCRMCASRSHDATRCPEMACRFCRAPEHQSFSCPTRLRCTKCRQLGHAKKDCSEKLALPREEMECAFCGSRDHVDAFCHELWRSFSCGPDTARRVRSLPIFCYCCGHQGHYGPVCGLKPQRSKETPWETWSQANCDRYLDPASSEVAITGVPAGSAPSSERPNFGKSIVPKRHIFFEEADDDDADEFIRPPVQKIPRAGPINFSGNSGGGRDEKGASRGYAQPPLPPGPPPPLPRRTGGRSRGGGARY
jgi:protein AIR1/2